MTNAKIVNYALRNEERMRQVIWDYVAERGQWVGSTISCIEPIWLSVDAYVGRGKPYVQTDVMVISVHARGRHKLLSIPEAWKIMRESFNGNEDHEADWCVNATISIGERELDNFLRNTE